MAKKQVRVRGWINSDGKWAAYGWTNSSDDDADEVLQDMMAGEDMGRPFWLVAEVDVPDSIEVPAAVVSG